MMRGVFPVQLCQHISCGGTKELYLPHSRPPTKQDVIAERRRIQNISIVFLKLTNNSPAPNDRILVLILSHLILAHLLSKNWSLTLTKVICYVLNKLYAWRALLSLLMLGIYFSIKLSRTENCYSHLTFSSKVWAASYVNTFFIFTSWIYKRSPIFMPRRWCCVPALPRIYTGHPDNCSIRSHSSNTPTNRGFYCENVQINNSASI